MGVGRRTDHKSLVVAHFLSMKLPRLSSADFLEEEPATMQLSFTDIYQIIEDCVRSVTGGRRFENVENCFW